MGISVVSLFSGGGGLDLGFQSEGYNIIWAIDNNQNAVNTYRANVGDHIICDDINSVPIEEIPHADVVIGGPPCQSFSLVGKRNIEDSRGRLVWRYIEIIEHIKPQAFVFENVTGLLSARRNDGTKVIDALTESFKEIGYQITANVMNAADYGVPQRRRRIIIVGLMNGNTFSVPAPTNDEFGFILPKYLSAKDALDDLGEPSKSEGAVVCYAHSPQNDFQRRMRGTESCVTEHIYPQMSEMDKEIVSSVKPGGNYRDLPESINSKRVQRLQKEGGHTTCYGRLDPDEPAYTINTYFNRPNVGCNIHYSQDRLITVREALRLQSFPDSYKIVSSSKQGKNSIVGNAVPPMLAKAVAHALLKYLNWEQQS